MPFERPTLAQLVDRTQADIEARLPGADSRLRRSVLGVLARVFAGVAHLLYGFLDWAWKQMFVTLAEGAILRSLHASKWGIPALAETYAGGNVTFAGVNGSVIPSGTLLQRSDARQYRTTAEATIVAGAATVPVEAVVAGKDGNAAAGSTLTLVSPVAGVHAAATVAAGGLVGGEDEETDDALRARILERIQDPPHGGAKADYRRWAKQVAGVTRAWIEIVEDVPGHKRVIVRFVMDGKADTIIPTTEEVAIVQAWIDGEDVRPVTAEVTVAAPVAVPLAITIQGLTPSTQAVKDAIEAEIRDLISREAEPGATILLSHIREAISIAAGEADHVLVAPAADVTHVAHEIAVFAPITWA